MSAMHQMLPIAMIPYANMAPFQEMGPPPGCAFVDCLPRDSIQALKDKRVWAAAVPVGGLAALRNETCFLGRYGIAVKERAMSVLFFCDRPFEQFRRPLTIGLTGESASSVRLLYLLLGYRHGFDAVPRMVPRGQPSNGYLVIGDRALRWAQEYDRTGAVQGFTNVVDLAALWYDRFQLPFVFARWVIHREAPGALKRSLHQWLQRFSEEEPALIEKATPKVAAKLSLPAAYAARYLRVIRRCLTEEDQAGQLRFQEELQSHGTGLLFETLNSAGPPADATDLDGMR
jgi:chorismate dehydratase